MIHTLTCQCINSFLFYEKDNANNVRIIVGMGSPCYTRGTTCALPAFKVEKDVLFFGGLAIPQLHGARKEVSTKPHSSKGPRVRMVGMIFELITYCALENSAAGAR